MKLLMSTDAVGGVWTYAMELCRALAPEGVEVVLATMGPAPSDAQREQAHALPNVRLVESRWKLEWMQDPWEEVAHAGEWLLALEDEHHPDIIHLNGYAHAALPWKAPSLVVAHSCVLGWWHAVHGAAAPEPQWTRYRQEVTRGLKAASAVVAPTRAMLETLRDHYRLRLSEAHVVPNGLEPSRFRSRAREPFVLAVGRVWDEAKDMAVLDAAARSLPWPVRIAGDATDPQSGSSRTLQHATALGRVDEATLRETQARAAVYAHPARYEPFGYGPLEAALSGCALVLSDIPSLREVWGEAALYARPGKPEQWSEVLRCLTRQETLRARMAYRARRRASFYTAQSMARRYMEVYESLLPNDANVTRTQETSTCAS